MANATADRNTPFAAGRMWPKGPFTFTAGVEVFAGTIAMIAQATGLIIKAGDTAGGRAVGFHMKYAKEADGHQPEVFGAVGWLANDGSITAAHLGMNAIVLDDQTVGLGSAVGTNDITAGVIEAVDATLGVLVVIL